MHVAGEGGAKDSFFCFVVFFHQVKVGTEGRSQGFKSRYGDLHFLEIPTAERRFTAWVSTIRREPTREESGELFSR